VKSQGKEYPKGDVEWLNDARAKLACFQHSASSWLDVLVQIDAKKHPEETQEVDFQFKAQGELEKDQIDGERWVNAWGEIAGEDRLNCAMWGHDPEDFSEYSAQ
jgi:hypothetical protein